MGVWEKPKLQIYPQAGLAAIGANSLNAGKLIATDAGWGFDLVSILLTILLLTEIPTGFCLFVLSLNSLLHLLFLAIFVVLVVLLAHISYLHIVYFVLSTVMEYVSSLSQSAESMCIMLNNGIT